MAYLLEYNVCFCNTPCTAPTGYATDRTERMSILRKNCRQHTERRAYPTWAQLEGWAPPGLSDANESGYDNDDDNDDDDDDDDDDDTRSWSLRALLRRTGPTINTNLPKKLESSILSLEHTHWKACLQLRGGGAHAP